MILISNISNGNNKINLLEIEDVNDVFCGLGDEISIHLSCDEGKEQKVFDRLPMWIHKEMTVVKSCTHVFLKAKEKQ